MEHYLCFTLPLPTLLSRLTARSHLGILLEESPTTRAEPSKERPRLLVMILFFFFLGVP
jgi:hypothetical protein